MTLSRTEDMTTKMADVVEIKAEPVRASGASPASIIVDSVNPVALKMGSELCAAPALRRYELEVVEKF